MSRLGTHVKTIRSKNAGPFWITIDLFCENDAVYSWCCETLKTSDISLLFQTPETDILRFDIANLHVIKFSFPRPVVQGAVTDRDMHGAAWAVLLQELPVRGAPVIS